MIFFTPGVAVVSGFSKILKNFVTKNGRFLRLKGMGNQLSNDFIYSNDYLHFTQSLLKAVFRKKHKKLRVVFQLVGDEWFIKVKNQNTLRV